MQADPNTSGLFDAKRQASEFIGQQVVKPSTFSLFNLGAFFSEAGYAIRLIFEEKEILVFAILQWLFIGFAFYLWHQAYAEVPLEIKDWVEYSLAQLNPNQVYLSSDRIKEIVAELHDVGMEQLYVLLAWVVVLVAGTALPLSCLNGAMVAAHNLRSQGYESTFFRCLVLSFRNIHRMWGFTVVDGVITVLTMWNRLPRRRGWFLWRSVERAAVEVGYYAWKLGTLGVVPSLAADRSYREAACESIELLKAEPLRVIGLRLGYGMIGWLIAAAGYLYVFSITFQQAIENPQRFEGLSKHAREFELLLILIPAALAPIVVAIGIVIVLVRPIYMIAISKLYTDYFHFGAVYSEALAEVSTEDYDERNYDEAVAATPEPQSSFFDSLITILILSSIAFVAYYLFSEPFDLSESLKSVMAKLGG